MLEQYVGTTIDLCRILYGLDAAYTVRHKARFHYDIQVADLVALVFDMGIFVLTRDVKH